MAKNIKGMNKLLKKLDGLDAQMKKSIAREAARAGAEVIYKAAKSKLHRAAGSYKVTLSNGREVVRQPGDLAKAMMMHDLPHDEIGGKHAVWRIGFARNDETDRIGYIAAFIEFGVSAHLIETKDGRSIQHTGHQAYPFMKPAVDENRAAARKAMQLSLDAALKSWW